MKRGDLVPDTTVLSMVAERTRCLRCCGGFILDGFPRTVAQAAALKELLDLEHVTLSAVINYELPIDKIVARLSGRRTCSGCKAIFHVSTLPPKVEGVCDHCGKPLLQREDDRPESVRVRMDAYERSTKPLINYFQAAGLLISVTAEGSPEDICARSIKALNVRTSAKTVPLPSKQRGIKPAAGGKAGS
jgi:adenylate kinase